MLILCTFLSRRLALQPEMQLAERESLEASDRHSFLPSKIVDSLDPRTTNTPGRMTEAQLFNMVHCICI